MPESLSEELARRLSAYPQEALPYFRDGFVAIAKTSESNRELVLNDIIEKFKSGSRRLDSSVIQDITGFSQKTADQIAGAYTLIIGLLSESSTTPSEFVEAARGLLFPPETETVVLSAATSICERRDEIKVSVEKSRLAGAVLPSLFTLEVAVDLRVRVEDGVIKFTTPVAIAHIDTDADNHELWVQLTKADVEAAIKSLTKALDDIKIAETMAARNA